MLTETITWRPVSPDDMPDADLVVNVAIDGSEEPVWLGAFDGEVWRDTEGAEITVTHWAPMLVGPHAVATAAPSYSDESSGCGADPLPADVPASDQPQGEKPCK